MSEEQTATAVGAFTGIRTMFSDEHRLANLRFLLIILALAGVASLGIEIAAYVVARAWQVLAHAAVLGVGWALLLWVRHLYRRAHIDAAGLALIGIFACTYGATVLFVAGVLTYVLVGGTLLVIMVGHMLIAQRWRLWLVGVLVYVAVVLAVNLLEPLPRFVVTDTPFLAIYFATCTICLGILFLWQIARVVTIGSIRGRLVFFFVLLTLFSTAIAGAGATVLGVQNGQRQVYALLESVVTLKEREVSNWLANLRASLLLEALREQSGERMQTLLLSPADSAAFQTAYDGLSNRFVRSIELRGEFEELFLMNLQGEVVLSTVSDQEDKVYLQEEFFRRGLGAFYTSPPAYSPPLERFTVILAQPVQGQDGSVVGVLAGRANMDTLNEIMSEQAGLGVSGETYLVGANYVMLSTVRSGYAGYVHTQATEAAIAAGSNGRGTYENYAGVPVVGVFRWVPELDVVLLAEQSQEEALAGVLRTLWFSIAAAVIAIILAVVASLVVARSIAQPIIALSATAAQVSSGNLDLSVPVGRTDEMGVLAQAFNSMTAQLRGLVSGLEQRVASRTLELEQRSAYLEASAEVARAASSILDTEQLIRQVVELIRQRFGLYYVGLFLVDESGEWAVLRAGTGEAGRAMLSRGHRRRVGEGMVGWSVARGQSRVMLAAGEDAVQLSTPELPETRSEAALPLRSRGQVLGALTVQSAQPAAFDPQTLIVLQTMADQVAVAIDNARLFAEAQQALQVTRRAFGELSRESWRELLHVRTQLAYRSDVHGVSDASTVWRQEASQALQQGQVVRGDGTETGRHYLAVPIRLRDDVIGVLDTYKLTETGEWTDQEVELLQALAEQLALALESTRLYQDTQRRAASEQMIGEVTVRIRESLDVETVLHTAAREIGQAMGLAALDIRLGSGKSGRD